MWWTHVSHRPEHYALEVALSIVSFRLQKNQVEPSKDHSTRPLLYFNAPKHQHV
ncbi:hypothetical protein HYC85_003699 [Camellia sinensis]|uniref:Uncharacterized protein n=1 Tax=Camellia sinensis TaxID=4442 RepID=A0A7J7HWK2_CAMSI|nr:hypothetical protein HYC85_003699 [Camellia sinensis]